MNFLSYYVEPGTCMGQNVKVFPCAVIGRQPQAAGCVTRDPGFGHAPTHIGAQSVIGANAVIYAGVWIGNDVLIGDGAVIREGCRLGASTVVGPLAFLQYNTHVGKRVRIGAQCYLCGEMVIEDDVFVSACVSTANDKYIRSATAETGWCGPVLRQGCSIGVGAILLPGIEIGAGAMVAAGAVVTKNVPPLTLAIGVPARIEDLPKGMQ